VHGFEAQTEEADPNLPASGFQLRKRARHGVASRLRHSDQAVEYANYLA
jgi:hypothetical protein